MSVMLWIALTGCGSDSDRPVDTSQPSPPPTDTAPATLDADRQQYLDQYERLQIAQRAISGVWEGLARGEQVQCGDTPDYPAPESITSSNDTQAALADHLQGAAIAINDAVNLWRAECRNPRPTIPPDVIDEGRFLTRAAGDDLRAASDLLPGP
jgi:hypothetical protein